MSCNEASINKFFRLNPEMYSQLIEIRDEYALASVSATLRLVIREHRKLTEQKDQARELVDTLKSMGLMA